LAAILVLLRGTRAPALAASSRRQGNHRMFKILLRTLSLLLVVAILLTPSTSFGRGPGGRGGVAGGIRGAGGPGGHGRELAKPGSKKKGKLNVGGESGLGNSGPHGRFEGRQQLTGGQQELGGKLENFAAGPVKLQRGAFGPDQFQPLRQKPGDNWPARDGQHQAAAQNAINDFMNGPQPFTAQWYADHPKAWQATHPHADAWAAVTTAGVAAWLGWAAYVDTPVYGGTYSTTYVYEQPAATADEGAADVSRDSDDSQSDADGNAGEWLALGAYSVQSSSGEPSSRFFQLSTNRQGELRGVYYDEISDSSQNLSGTIDQSSRVATWTLDTNEATTFRANLNDLTQATGTVEVTQPSGNQQWRIARQQDST